MDNLWAPWRMKFIEDMRAKHAEGSACVFCTTLKSQDSSENLVLHRGAHAFVVMNKYPYTTGHLLILPVRHVSEVYELSAPEQQEMMLLMGKSIQVLRSALHAEGFNCGLNLGKVAGAGILGHVHMHVVPRWAGDTNFLPVFSDTRSMPEYLHETYDRLIGHFA